MMPTTLPAGLVRQVLVFASLAAAMLQAGSTRYELHEEWERPIGWVSLLNPSMNLAVCADGSVYLIDSHGNAKIIRADGNVTDAGSIGKTAGGPISCDSQGQLYVAGRDLAIFEPGPDGKLALSSTSRLKSKFEKILVTPSGSVFGIDRDPLSATSELRLLPERDKPLWRVTWQLPVFSADGTILLRASPGFLIWNQNNQRLLCMLPGENRIEFFDDKGNRLPAASDGRPFVGGPSLPEAARLMGLVRLAEGGFVAEVSEGEDFLGYAATTLRVMDDSLKPVSAPIPPPNAGFLVGSTPDGSLYFLNMAGGAFTLVKQKLVVVAEGADGE